MKIPKISFSIYAAIFFSAAAITGGLFFSLFFDLSLASYFRVVNLSRGSLEHGAYPLLVYAVAAFLAGGLSGQALTQSWQKNNHLAFVRAFVLAFHGWIAIAIIFDKSLLAALIACDGLADGKLSPLLKAPLAAGIYAGIEFLAAPTYLFTLSYCLMLTIGAASSAGWLICSSRRFRQYACSRPLYICAGACTLLVLVSIGYGGIRFLISGGYWENMPVVDRIAGKKRFTQFVADPVPPYIASLRGGYSGFPSGYIKTYFTFTAPPDAWSFLRSWEDSPCESSLMRYGIDSSRYEMKQQQDWERQVECGREPYLLIDTNAMEGMLFFPGG